MNPHEPTAARRPRLAPDAIPGFIIGRELGRGGMGVVFEATQASLGRKVALKMVLADEQATDRQRERLQREARVMARFQHPNVVQVFDRGETGGQPWYALEFCDGGSLADRLEAGPLSPSDAVSLLVVLAEAVAAVHAEGVLHRDLKPDNVLFTSKGMPKVADFGLVREPDGAGTRTGIAVGTPSYMPPEQARGEKVDVRADVYALGAILYECLTGRPPYRGPNAVATLALVLLWDPPPKPPRSLNARVSPELEAVCGRAMHPDANLRYQSAAEFGAALRGLARLESEPPAEVVSRRAGTVSGLPTAELRSADTTVQTKLRAQRSSWQRLGWAAACLAVLAVGSAAGVVWSPRPSAISTTIVPTRSDKPPTTPTLTPEKRATPMAWPCTPAKATAAQAEWAKTLGGKPTREIELGGGERMTLVLIPPGTFTMGSPETEPNRDGDETPHPATIREPFWLGKTEVTQAQYRAVTGESPSWYAPTGAGKNMLAEDTPSSPVESVRWADATAFCKEVSRRSGVPLTLPTEAQWEWACRAGSSGPFPFAKADTDEYAWYAANSRGRTWQVASKRANAFGLFDMHGNVGEWCADWYGGYSEEPASDPAGPKSGDRRVFRGGAWGNPPSGCRSASRFGARPSDPLGLVGFRVAAPAR